MDELFTFNSRQLRNITNRPPLSSTSPKYRKRILSSKLSKKLNKLSQIIPEEKTSQTDRLPIRSIQKKVTFKISSPSVYLKKDEEEIKEFPRQPKSMMIKKKEEKNTERVYQISSTPLTKETSASIVKRLVKRTFSAVERKDRI